MKLAKIAFATMFAAGLSATPTLAQDATCEARIAEVQEYVDGQQSDSSKDVARTRARTLLTWAAEDGQAGNQEGCLQHVESAAGVIGMPS